MKFPRIIRDTLLNTRELGIYSYRDGTELIIGVTVWNQIFGLNFTVKDRKSRISSAKRNDEAVKIRDLIAYLNQTSYPRIQSDESTEPSEGTKQSNP